MTSSTLFIRLLFLSSKKCCYCHVCDFVGDGLCNFTWLCVYLWYTVFVTVDVSCFAHAKLYIKNITVIIITLHDLFTNVILLYIIIVVTALGHNKGVEISCGRSDDKLCFCIKFICFPVCVCVCPFLPTAWRHKNSLSLPLSVTISSLLSLVGYFSYCFRHYW